LAAAAIGRAQGDSASAFHQHFKAVASLSPLRFQKRLRLIEARRLMQSQSASAGSAAYSVGYESVPQFTRECIRLFGKSFTVDARVPVMRMRELAWQERKAAVGRLRRTRGGVERTSL
jgi:AraC-like DNA-binding protein